MNFGKTIEYKVKLVGEGRKWEELPIIGEITIGFSLSGDDLDPFEYIKIIWELLRMNGESPLEIRWNYRGSLQGHYYDGRSG